jgi:hypothetical protein
VLFLYYLNKNPFSKGIHMKCFSLLIISLLTVSSALAANGKSFIAAGKIDLTANTITLPLRQGSLNDGTKFWFILTDSSSKTVSNSLGLGYAPQLAAAALAKSSRHVHVDQNGSYTFDRGTIDFSPVRTIVPGDAPNFFPPKVANPGSVASADYSPFAVADDANGTIYNAPIIAAGLSLTELILADGTPNYALVHDKVVGIDTVNSLVTLQLTHGFTDSHDVVYLSFDASIPLAATLEAATYAPAEADLVGTTAALDLYAFANGETGSSNPNHQGFDSALSGDGSPLNILTLPAKGTSYTPLWSVNVGIWSSAAIAAGDRKRLINESDVLAAAQTGEVTNPDGTALGEAGFVVNCPVVQVLGL